MRKIVMAVMAAASVIFASCDQGRDIAVSEFTVDMANDGNTVRVSVVPSDESVSYCTGLIMEDDYAALGEDGLVSYINDQVASAELKTGPSTEVYQDLLWQTHYYAFVAQINDGSVYGEPVVESVKTYRPYVEFAPEGTIIAPYAVSDNGRWVVGNYQGETMASYIYDVRRDSLTIVDGVMLYDITDAGVAYGKDFVSPVYYEDGQIKTVAAPAGSMESGFYGVSPDGSVAVGYCMTETYDNAAIVYENGTIANITGTDINGQTPDGIVAKGIGANGNIAGYLLDSEYGHEFGCMWRGTSHEFDLFADEYTGEWNEELYAYTKRYGDLEIVISPSGRYLAGKLQISESWEHMPTLAYVYDSEEDRMYEISDVAYNEYRPCAVTSTGLLFLADVPFGVSSQPYVWDFSTDQVSTFADYASQQYGYAPEGVTIQGSVLATSDDGTVVVGNYTSDTAFHTTIYFMPEE